MLNWLADHWLWVTFFVTSCVVDGIYMGLQDRFGPDVIAGYRRYKISYERANKDWDMIVDHDRRLAAGDPRALKDQSDYEKLVWVACMEHNRRLAAGERAPEVEWPEFTVRPAPLTTESGSGHSRTATGRFPHRVA